MLNRFNLEQTRRLNLKQFTEKKLLSLTIFYTLTTFKMSIRVERERDSLPAFPM